MSMRHLAAIAMIVAALVLPATAQHAASRGGFSGHGIAAPHGSFGSSSGGFATHGGSLAARGGISAPYARFGRPGGLATQRFSGSYGAPRFNSHFRPVYRGNENDMYRSGHGPGGGDRHHRMPYHRGFDSHPYLYAGNPYYGYPIFTGYVDPWLFGPDTYENESAYDNSAPPYGDYDVPAPYPNYGAQGYGADEYGTGAYGSGGIAPLTYQAPAPTQQPGARRPSYAPSGTSSPSLREDAVTLIFNDGRPPERIHNYLLTSTTLTVLDSQYREIPLEQINVAATEQANRAAGVDFRVPPFSH